MNTFSLKRFAVLVVLLSSFLSSTAQKKYPSLLWEITGNGMKAPSYLYGTMHVSDRLAYHLSDSFFVALNSVNVVGLESNPDQWLKNMKEIGLLDKANAYGSYFNDDFYKDAFKIEIPDNKQYAGMLANDPDLVNGLLYRNNSNNEEYEESTYIDLFIYKFGSKLGKKVISLEDFKTSLVMATKASVPDPNEVMDKSKRNVNYYKVQNLINDSYRSGDLDALDSLTQLTYYSKNMQKYMIEDRNAIHARSIDSVCKSTTIFAGVGAAHLPGKKGVIELLRAMGYTLRPIANISTKKGKKQKEAIEAMVKKVSASKQRADDSLFTYELFEQPVSIANSKGFSFALLTDMANGSYYTISRQVSYAGLINYTVDKMLIKMDSLLFENIPGKIVSKKEITSNTGIKGFDIVNKTKKGDLQRYQIYIRTNEVIVFKMAGKGDYVKGAEGTRFFSSINFEARKDQGEKVFEPATKGFAVKMPAESVYLSHKKTSVKALSEELFGFEPNSKMATGVMHYFYNDYNYLEEDTFELNVLATNALKNFDYNTEVKRELGREQGLSCINFSGVNKTLAKKMYGKIFIKGSHYYLVYSINDGVTATRPEEYFASFKLTDFKHIYDTPVVNDKEFFFSVKDEASPIQEKDQLEEALAGFYEEVQKAKDDKKHSTDFDYTSLTKTYYSPSSGEHVNVEYEKYNDYDYRDPKKFWDDVKEGMKYRTSFIMSKPVMSKTNGLETMELTLRDTACSSMIKRKYILREGVLYTLSAVCDTAIGVTGWTSDFFKTFTPKDSSVSKPIFEKKIDKIVKDLASSDSSLRYAVENSLYHISDDKSYSDALIKYMRSDAFLKLKEDSRALIMVNAGGLEDEKFIPVYKELFAKYEDSSYMQICIIKGLGYIKSKNSAIAMFDMLKNKTPLTGSEDNITNIFEPLYDSLELYSGFFPDLFALNSFEEYKTPVYKLFSELAIRKIIPVAKYTPQVPALLTEANNELKRYTASSSKGNKGGDFDYESALSDALGQLGQYSTETVNKSAPTYTNMVENFAAVLAPFYTTNPAVKQHFDKLFKIKDEGRLLSICLIAEKYSIPVNDTMWKFFSNNAKTKVRLYKELEKIKKINKYDQSKLSQEAFCRNMLEDDLDRYKYDYQRDDLKEKEKTDSLYFLRKEAVKNKDQNGFMYFYERVDAKSKEKTLAYAFVNQKDETKISTDIDVMETDRPVEIGKTTEETIGEIKSEFYYQGRKRYGSGDYNDLFKGLNLGDY